VRCCVSSQLFSVLQSQANYCLCKAYACEKGAGGGGKGCFSTSCCQQEAML
jgi:hypothetical protein